MKAIDIRNKYLNFFERHGHKLIPSAPLIPENDPSVMFNIIYHNINYFKYIFQELEKNMLLFRLESKFLVTNRNKICSA